MAETEKIRQVKELLSQVADEIQACKAVLRGEKE